MANIHGYLSGVESVCKLEPRDMGANDDLYYVLNMDVFPKVNTACQKDPGEFICSRPQGRLCRDRGTLKSKFFLKLH